MIKLNVHEAKTHLSKYLDKVAHGETILLCKRNVPIAEIRPIQGQGRIPRPIGLAKGLLKIKSEFYEPLPEDILKLFNGER